MTTRALLRLAVWLWVVVAVYLFLGIIPAAIVVWLLTLGTAQNAGKAQGYTEALAMLERLEADSLPDPHVEGH